MKIQSTHSHEDRGLDAYFSPPEAIYSLMEIEKDYIPKNLWEPACGDGAITLPLRDKGYHVLASDIVDYECPGGFILDYLNTSCPSDMSGIITNPPYKLAETFIRKAILEVKYSAFLLRTNFLESVGRLPLFRFYPPTIVHIASRRLPMMHRYGWEGKKAPSNTCHAWFVWDKDRDYHSKIDWFDWKELCES